MKKIFCIIGTRPEAIKMAPVILELTSHRNQVNTLIVSTGQHSDILLDTLSDFNLHPDVDLKLMSHNQTLSDITSRALSQLQALFDNDRPDLVLGQGDTSSVMAASLACFYNKIPFAHIEAGLRTQTIHSPWPEELNRRIVSLVADLHFAPTSQAQTNLLKEGIDQNKIFHTGNTVIDALLNIRDKNPILPIEIPSDKELVLLTAHRRENIGERMSGALGAIRRFIDENPRLLLVCPVHPNPNVKAIVQAELADHPRIRLIPPVKYPQLVALLDRSIFVLSDSGGIQEEAPSFKKPVLILRESTERPEAVECGAAALVGCNQNTIYSLANKLLLDQTFYRSMQVEKSPFGDGNASRRIWLAIKDYLKL